jgi:hypothetical protein
VVVPVKHHLEVSLISQVLQGESIGKKVFKNSWHWASQEYGMTTTSFACRMTTMFITRALAQQSDPKDGYYKRLKWQLHRTRLYVNLIRLGVLF